VGGPLETNAYLIHDDTTKEAIVIDAPMDVTDRILRAVETAGLRISLIVITHPHWDHISDAALLKERSGAPLAAHPLAVERLAKPDSLGLELPFTIRPTTADQLLNEGDEVQLGQHRFLV